MNAQEQPKTIKLPEHFTLYRPAEKITGDFYFSKILKNHIIFCVADFSINGINGNEIKKLGTDYLNEIIHYYETNSENVISASNIVKKLILKLNSTLLKEHINLAKSLNISLAIINQNTNNNTFNIQWSGVNNPLYFVKKEKLKKIDDSIIYYEKSTTNAFLYEIKANDIKAENINENVSLTNHEINLQKSEVIYLFSDGLVEQIGGPFDKKFMDTQFKNIILDMNDNEIQDQKYVLDYAFELWKGDNPQIDDICIVGLKL